MNIMEIVSGHRVNGAIYHCLLLSRELLRRGNRVTLVCYPDSWIYEHAPREGIEVVGSTLHRWPLAELRRIAGEVRRRRIDVIHTHTSRSNFFGVLLRWFSGAPSVATAHSRHIQLHWMFNDRVIAVSEATRRYQRTHNFVRAGRIETIHNFIDHDAVAALPDARERVRREFGFNDQTPLVGIVGGITPRKGLIYLVQAMPQILQALPETRLLVIGPGIRTAYGEQVQAVVDRLDLNPRVIWTDQRNDVNELLAAIDLFALPSLEESFPLAILEAMAAGRAVVSTPVGGIPECLIDGETGVMVPPGQIAPLARAVVDLLRDPVRRAELGAAGKRFVAEHFSAESQTPKIEAALAKVARRKTKIAA